MMADERLIDANALKNLLIEVLERIKENPTMKSDEIHIIAGCHMLCEMIDDAPTIDAVEVVHGYWDWLIDGYYCSECDHKIRKLKRKPNYCERCGAKMEGGASDV